MLQVASGTGSSLGSMTEHGSAAWLEALNAKLSAQPQGSSPTPLVVQYDVQRDDGVAATYHLRLAPEADTAMAGVADAPDITFSMAQDTAERIAAGELSSEEAFITGLLDIEGDPGGLIEAHRSSTETDRRA